MKKTLIVALGLITTSAFAYSDANAYKDGFESGLKALKFQVANDGVMPKKIDLPRKYVLLLPIDRISIDDAIYMQYTAAKEDFKTHITKNELIFGNYDRLIDAQVGQAKIKDLFNYESKIVENIKDYYTYPVIAEPVFNEVAASYRKDGAIKETKIIYVNTGSKANSEKIIVENNKTKSSTVTKKSTKPLVIKNAELKYDKAQSYRLKNGGGKSSKDFIESYVVEKQNFRTANTITTKEGESFVKVLNENTYFLKSDVEIKWNILLQQ